MIGDYSSINDHLETARKLADTAETKADPAIYREAIVNWSLRYAC